MKKALILYVVLLIVALASPVFATGGTGQIKIWPPLPAVVSSPATFNVTVTTGKSYDPHILLVMTSACYQGLSGNVVVTWKGGSVTFTKSDFTGDNKNSDKVPPGTTDGAAYTIASLKSELQTGTTVYWACKSFLSGPITTKPTSFTITITSTHTKMLVYALGRSYADTNTFSLTSGIQCVPLLDMKTPNTIPGFVLPELTPALLSLGSFAALGLYAIKRRET